MNFYEGEWLKGKYNGKGYLRMKEGTYQGEFVNGKPHGIGTFSNDTLSYQGSFNSGSAAGPANIIYKTGEKLEAVFQENEALRGVLHYCNGD